MDTSMAHGAWRMAHGERRATGLTLTSVPSMPFHSEAGDRKHSDSWLATWDHALSDHLVAWVPMWLASHHLTLLTLLWSALVMLFGALATLNRTWLWAVSVVIVLQYLTDAVDGKVGRIRGAGLV